MTIKINININIDNSIRRYLVHTLFLFFNILVIIILGILSFSSNFALQGKKIPTFIPNIYAQGLFKPIITALRDSSYRERDYPYNAGEDGSGVILHGARSSKRIALTFDAEMTEAMRQNYLTGAVSSSFDSRILATLNETRTKATLFLTGMWMELYPDIVKKIARNPLFELGSHSYADTSYDGDCYGLPQLPESEGSHDIELTQKLLKTATGKTNAFFRFPGGCYSQKSLNLVAKEKLTVIHWDVSGNDGFNDNKDSIVQQVISRTQNGSIIILHLNGEPTAPKTADALPDIITILKSRGFTFVTVSELLDSNQIDVQNKFDIKSLLVSYNFQPN